jgi:hypothetical protein
MTGGTCVCGGGGVRGGGGEEQARGGGDTGQIQNHFLVSHSVPLLPVGSDISASSKNSKLFPQLQHCTHSRRPTQ